MAKSLKINAERNSRMLFFELLQIALGNRERLSMTPSAEEWTEIYAGSDRQSVTGLLIHGIDRLKNLNSDLNLNQRFLLQWIGIGQMIEQRNRLLNGRCLELLSNLTSVGLHPTILKGQGVAQCYPEALQKLRQPGDIDVFVSDGREKAIAYAKSLGQKDIDWDYKHLHLKLWNDTEVEMHYHVEVLLNLWKNRKLQKWFKVHAEQLYGHTNSLSSKVWRCEVTDTTDQETNTNFTNGLITPSVEFNVFYILLHIYRHFLYEGVGLRQIVDYYMTLRMVNCSRLMVHDYVNAVHEFRMEKFAKGLMWVMHETLGMSCEWMLWEPDEREGRYILNQVMTGGNFGHHDERLKHTCGKIGAVKAILTHNLHLLTHYPSDVIWAPVWIVWHKLWKVTRI